MVDESCLYTEASKRCFPDAFNLCWPRRLAKRPVDDRKSGTGKKKKELAFWSEDDICGGCVLPADTEMPAPAMTTILFFLLNAVSSLTKSGCCASPQPSRSICCVVRCLGPAAIRRFLAGGGPSVRTRISAIESDMWGFLMGEALPEVVALDEGDGYLLETSMAGESGEGDRDRTESGEDGGDDVGRRRDAIALALVGCQSDQKVNCRLRGTKERWSRGGLLVAVCYIMTGKRCEMQIESLFSFSKTVAKKELTFFARAPRAQSRARGRSPWRRSDWQQEASNSQIHGLQ